MTVICRVACPLLLLVSCLFSFVRGQEEFNATQWSQLIVASDPDNGQGNTSTSLSQENPPNNFRIFPTKDIGAKKIHNVGTWMAAIRCISELGRRDWNAKMPDDYICKRGGNIAFSYNSYKPEGGMRTKHAIWAMAGILVFFEYQAKEYVETFYFVKLGEALIGGIDVMMAKPRPRLDGDEAAAGDRNSTSVSFSSPARNGSSTSPESAVFRRSEDSNKTDHVSFPGDIVVNPHIYPWSRNPICTYFSLFFMFVNGLIELAEQPLETLVHSGISRYHTKEHFSYRMYESKRAGSWPNKFTVDVAMNATELIADWESHDLDLPYKRLAFTGTIVDDVYLVGEFAVYAGRVQPVGSSSADQDERQAAANGTFA